MTAAARIDLRQSHAEYAVGPLLAAPAWTARAALLRDAALWAGGIGLALALHAGIGWWALGIRAEPPPPSLPPGAIALALEPLPAAPAIAASAPALDPAPDALAPPREAARELAMPLLDKAPAGEDPVVPREAPSVAAALAIPLPRPRPADLPVPERAAAAPAPAPAPPGIERATREPAAPAAPAAAARQQGGSLARPEIAPERYEAALLAHLERNKRYPRAARVRGDEGVVTVLFTLDRNGRVSEARVLRSSGSTALDGAALDTVRRASPMPAPPAGIRRLSFTVPMRFDLR